jgi:hypothetical protein
MEKEEGEGMGTTTFSSRPLDAARLSLCLSSACSAASRIWLASLLARRSASALFRASSICA